MSDVHAAEAVNDAPVVDSDVEVRARRLGWVPKEEFRGDPDKHRSADEFLERGTTILPILQRDNEKLHGQVSALQQQIRETQEATKELLAFTSRSEERAYNRAKAEIEARIENAAATADPNAVRQGMRELDALNAEQVKVAPKPVVNQQAVELDPVIQDWLGKETWYSDPKNRSLNAFATELFDELSGLPTAKRLEEVKKRTVAKFPEKFGLNPARENAATVSTPTGEPVRRKTGKSYDDLPADAKKACDKFVKQIPGYTREKYVQDYDWNA